MLGHRKGKQTKEAPLHDSMKFSRLILFLAKPKSCYVVVTQAVFSCITKQFCLFWSCFYPYYLLPSTQHCFNVWKKLICTITASSCSKQHLMARGDKWRTVSRKTAALLNSASSLNPSQAHHCLISQLAPTIGTWSGPGPIPEAPLYLYFLY